jgi:hypothetical protein
MPTYLYRLPYGEVVISYSNMESWGCGKSGVWSQIETEKVKSGKKPEFYVLRENKGFNRLGIFAGKKEVIG